MWTNQIQNKRKCLWRKESPTCRLCGAVHQRHRYQQSRPQQTLPGDEPVEPVLEGGTISETIHVSRTSPNSEIPGILPKEERQWSWRLSWPQDAHSTEHRCGRVQTGDARAGENCINPICQPASTEMPSSVDYKSIPYGPEDILKTWHYCSNMKIHLSNVKSENFKSNNAIFTAE